MAWSLNRECAVLSATAGVVALLLYGPPVVGLALDGTRMDDGLGGESRFVGASNFSAALADPTYRSAIVATASFTVTAVVVQVGIGFVLAMLTRRDFTGVRAVRAMIFAPYLLPTVVVVAAWRFVSDPFVGPLPALCRALFGSSPDFRGPDAALPVMVGVATYEALPFSYVILLARLRQIPGAYYEMAALCGAGPLKTFLAVTWPQIRGTLVLVVLLRMLLTWLKFDVPWLVYASRAGTSAADTLSVMIYRTAFENLHWGKACAASVLLLAAALYAYAAWLALAGDRVSAPGGGGR